MGVVLPSTTIRSRDARRIRIARVSLSVLLVVFCGCTAVNPMIAQSWPKTAQQQAQEIEPMLDTAGFQSLPASSPQQKNRLKALPSMKLGYSA